LFELGTTEPQAIIQVQAAFHFEKKGRPSSRPSLAMPVSFGKKKASRLFDKYIKKEETE
jgi:hypothetical protein